jgi:hypothetical protein
MSMKLSLGTLLRTGRPEIKNMFETLLKGGSVTVPVDEQIQPANSYMIAEL